MDFCSLLWRTWLAKLWELLRKFIMAANRTGWTRVLSTDVIHLEWHLEVELCGQTHTIRDRWPISFPSWHVHWHSKMWSDTCARIWLPWIVSLQYVVFNSSPYTSFLQVIYYVFYIKCLLFQKEESLIKVSFTRYLYSKRKQERKNVFLFQL